MILFEFPKMGVLDGFAPRRGGVCGPEALFSPQLPVTLELPRVANLGFDLCDST